MRICANTTQVGVRERMPCNREIAGTAEDKHGKYRDTTEWRKGLCASRKTSTGEKTWKKAEQPQELLSPRMNFHTYLHRIPSEPQSRRNRTVPIDFNAEASTLLLRSGTAGSRALPANTDLERSVRLYKALAAAHRHQAAAAAEQLLSFLRIGGQRRRCHPGSVLLRLSQPRVECGARRPRLSDCPPGRVQCGRWLRGERASPGSILLAPTPRGS